MPNIKAAEKWVRQTEKRRERNLATKSRLKTIFKRVKAAGDAASRAEGESAFDKAAQKGVIHPNKAARKKSRLAKAIAAAAVAQAAPAKPARKRAAKKA